LQLGPTDRFTLTPHLSRSERCLVQLPFRRAGSQRAVVLSPAGLLGAVRLAAPSGVAAVWRGGVVCAADVELCEDLVSGLDGAAADDHLCRSRVLRASRRAARSDPPGCTRPRVSTLRLRVVSPVAGAPRRARSATLEAPRAQHPWRCAAARRVARRCPRVAATMRHTAMTKRELDGGSGTTEPSNRSLLEASASPLAIQARTRRFDPQRPVCGRHTRALSTAPRSAVLTSVGAPVLDASLGQLGPLQRPRTPRIRLECFHAASRAASWRPRPL